MDEKNLIKKQEEYKENLKEYKKGKDLLDKIAELIKFLGGD